MANGNTFKVGDCVTLTSNNHQMTITEINGDSAYCIWIDKNQKYGDEFPLVTLKPCRKASDAGGIFMG